MLNLNCVICAELFKQADDVYATFCGHMFHYVCLKQWMERSKSCPQCRNKCTDRNIFRVYFNLANLDVSRIDIGSLQEQLDNANLQLKMKDQELNKLEMQVKDLKDVQKKCMKTISGLELKLKKNDFIILSFSEQVKLLKADSKLVDELRKEIKSLKQQISTMESVSALLTANESETEKLLKKENDPKKLGLLATTFKRELRISETKRSDLRNVLKVVQNDLRKEIDLKKKHEERISQLESDNYQLSEKLKKIEAESNKNVIAFGDTTADAKQDNLLPEPSAKNSNRLTISPTIKENIKKIEESNSPYLNIKSSSIGLVPLFKRPNETLSGGLDRASGALATLKISPTKNLNSISLGVPRKTSSDLSEKYSIFKKPRIMDLPAVAAGATSSSRIKPLSSNLAFDGFGGSSKVNPFAEDNSNLSEEEKERRSQKLPLKTANALSLNNRLKMGGLRNFKLNKKLTSD